MDNLSVTADAVPQPGLVERSETERFKLGTSVPNTFSGARLLRIDFEHVTNIGKKDIKERVNYMLELVHLEDKAKVYPEFLSGGEQQRVAVARALAHSPRLVIADEPTGNIDPEMSLEMMELLERVSEMGITVLVVTHEHELVRRFNRRTITLKQGRIISDVPASFGEEVHA